VLIAILYIMRRLCFVRFMQIWITDRTVGCPTAVHCMYLVHCEYYRSLRFG
jgi:hypothetical protein